MNRTVMNIYPDLNRTMIIHAGYNMYRYPNSL